jgi:DNA-binding protein YbaB
VSTTELTGRLAEYARLAEQVRAVRDGVEEVRATGYSDDGLVTAVVGGRGELLELELDPRIYRDRDAAALATKIVAAIHEAAADADQQAAELLVPGRDDADARFDPALNMLKSAMEDRK